MGFFIVETGSRVFPKSNILCSFFINYSKKFFDKEFWSNAKITEDDFKIKNLSDMAESPTYKKNKDIEDTESMIVGLRRGARAVK